MQLQRGIDKQSLLKAFQHCMQCNEKLIATVLSHAGSDSQTVTSAASSSSEISWDDMAICSYISTATAGSSVRSARSSTAAISSNVSVGSA
ncbi:hypothetical protein ACLKA7_005465 [Drosophila subpalustris]